MIISKVEPHDVRFRRAPNPGRREFHNPIEHSFNWLSFGKTSFYQIKDLSGTGDIEQQGEKESVFITGNELAPAHDIALSLGFRQDRQQVIDQPAVFLSGFF